MSEVAQAMHVSVPAITKAMKNLEADVGVTLFDRTGYRIGLNQFGESLASHAKSIMAEIDDAKRDISLLKESTLKQLRVSVTPGFMYELIPRAICLLRERVPGAMVHTIVQDTFRSTPSSDLANGLCDLALSRSVQGEDLSKFSFEPIGRMTLELVASKNHPACKLHKPKLKDLVGYDWIFPGLTGMAFETIHTVFRESGASLPINIQVMSHRGMISTMLRNGEFLCLIPHNEKLFSDHLGDVVGVDLDLPKYGWTQYIIQRKNSIASATVNEFIDVIRLLLAD